LLFAALCGERRRSQLARLLFVEDKMVSVFTVLSSDGITELL
jgi:hypothetical protein